MNGGGMFQRTSVEEQVRRQVEQYLLHRSMDYFGDRSVVPVQIAVEMCIHLTKHLTERLEAHEKLAYDLAMMQINTTLMPIIPEDK